MNKHIPTKELLNLVWRYIVMAGLVVLYSPMLLVTLILIFIDEYIIPAWEVIEYQLGGPFLMNWGRLDRAKMAWRIRRRNGG